MSLRTIALWACLLCASVSFAESYKVQKGDNDHIIARKVGISVSELHRLNPDTDWRRLQIGDTLKTSASQPKTHVGSKKSAVKDLPKAGGLHKVVSGESDYSISRKFGISITQLKALNPNVSFDPLNVGTQLRVPTGKVSSASNAVVKAAPKPSAPKPVAKPDTGVNLIKTVNAVVVKDLATIRTRPSADGRKITLADKGAVGEIVGREGNWYKLKFANSKQGWVRGDLLGSTEKNVSAHVAQVAKPKSATAAATYRPSAAAGSLIASAMDQVGIRYVYGGTSRSGFDCSGFVGYVFRKHGISLPRTAAQQWNVGTAVPRSALQPGDLLFFRTRGSRISHVGLSLGGSRFVHASSGKGRITVSELSGYYANRYAGARRVLKGNAVASAVYEYVPTETPGIVEPPFDPEPVPTTPKVGMGSDVITK